MTQITSGRTALGRFNTLGAAQAQRELLDCCASRRWATAVAEGRPYVDAERVLRMSDAAFATLTEADIAAALATHPRIGDRAEGQSRDAAWSRREQSAAADASDAVKQAIADGNAAYEARFGRVFLICARGLSGEQILAGLHARLGNDDETEHGVVHEELRKITRIRLEELIA